MIAVIKLIHLYRYILYYMYTLCTCVWRSQWYWQTSSIQYNIVNCDLHLVVRVPELNPFCLYLIQTASCVPDWPQTPP